MAHQVGELHAKRLGRVAGGRILEQRFFALQQRYAALATMMKSTQDPQLVEHATRCNLELRNHPAARLPQAFDFLRQIYHQVYFATLNYNLVGGRYLMTTAEVQMKDAVKLCDAAEASLVVLESWQKAFRLANKQKNLLIAIQSMGLHYEHLRNQWQAIDPIVCEGAIVRILSLNACISAFGSRGGAPLRFVVDLQMLDQSVGAITIAIAAHHFGDSEFLLQNATAHCTRLQHFIFNLGRAVKEYRAVETTVQAEQNKSEARISKWMSDIHSPIDPQTPNSRPYNGLKSRFQLGREQYYKGPTFEDASRTGQAPIDRLSRPVVGSSQQGTTPKCNAPSQVNGGRPEGLVGSSSIRRRSLQERRPPLSEWRGASLKPPERSWISRKGSKGSIRRSRRTVGMSVEHGRR